MILTATREHREGSIPAMQPFELYVFLLLLLLLLLPKLLLLLLLLLLQ